MRSLTPLLVLPLGLLFSGCETGYQAGIRPGGDFEIRDGIANSRDATLAYQLQASGTNGCCSVIFDVENPAAAALTLDLATARLHSSCGTRADTLPGTFRADGAETIADLLAALGRPGSRYSQVFEPQTVTIPANRAARFTFNFGQWRKNCLPYRFSMDLPRGRSVQATFFEIK